MGPLSQTHPEDPLVPHSSWWHFFFFLMYVFICFWLLCVFVATQTSSSYGEQGLLLVVVPELHVEVASLVAEHRM